MNVLKINHFCIDISVLYCSIYLLLHFHPFERISFTLYFEEIEFESPTLICIDSHSVRLYETVSSAVGQTVRQAGIVSQSHTFPFKSWNVNGRILIKCKDKGQMGSNSSLWGSFSKFLLEKNHSNYSVNIPEASEWHNILFGVLFNIHILFDIIYWTKLE